MMKKIFISMATLLLCGGVAFSQSHIDAYKLSQSDLVGTARYMSMGGAFGALGGDITSMKTNPAGLAVYRSSEVVTSLSVTSASTNTNWFGNTNDSRKTTFSFDNIAYVGYFPTANDEGILGWNFGFAYNRVKNFKRSYTMSAGKNNLDNSLSDYTAVRAWGTPWKEYDDTGSYDPYKWNGDWTSILGFNAGFIEPFNSDDAAYYSVFQDKINGDWVSYGIDDAVLSVYESGSIDEYDISFGTNISDIVMLGATVSITDINYNMETMYDEFFQYDKNDLFLDNGLSVDGTGYAFNIGAIVRPADFLRLGVAYNSPTWYKMTDYYYGDAGSNLTWVENGVIKERGMEAHTPSNASTDYEFRSPDRWIFSAAAILGQSALISVDYELTNYKNMRVKNEYGDEKKDVTEDVKMAFGVGNTFRVGAEYKVTPQFAIRAGGAWSSTPLKAIAKNGDMEVRTVGTIPHFTLDKGITNYTVGLGYRFTPNFYTDLACVFSTYKEDVYNFSSLFDEEGVAIIQAQPGTLKTNKTRVSLTLGYKF